MFKRYIYIFIYICMNVYSYLQITQLTRVYIGIGARTYIHAHTHTYMDTYIHSFIHTYIHTYIDS